MKPLLLAGAVVALGQTLATDYSSGLRLRIESTSELTIETTSMSMERDGEPVESPRGGGGATSKESRRLVQIDEVLAAEAGRPTQVRRTFEAIESEISSQFGDRSSELEREAPLEEVTLDVSVGDDGEIEVEVVEGATPDDEFLEGHRPALELDALLPPGEVAEGDAWELDGDAIRRALGVEVEAALFPRPAPPEDEGEGGRRGGRGRGGFGRGGGAPVNLFPLGEWRGEATLESLTEDHEGTTCAAIAIEIECEGELPEMGSGGGRRGGFAAGPARAAGENEFEVRAQGRLLYSLADRRPVAFDLEGKLSYERHSERSSERGTFSFSSSHEGTFTQSVRITEVESEK